MTYRQMQKVEVALKILCDAVERGTACKEDHFGIRGEVQRARHLLWSNLKRDLERARKKPSAPGGFVLASRSGEGGL